MALIGNLSDIPELGPVPAGEYDLRITSAKVKTYDSGASCINLGCEVIGEDNADSVWHKLWLPTNADDQSKQANKLRQIKDFMTALGMDTSAGVEDASEFVGQQFTAKLSLVPHYQDPDKFINEVERVL
jgi:hypothetical protein